jgi:hypothetical protein
LFGTWRLTEKVLPEKKTKVSSSVGAIHRGHLEIFYFRKNVSAEKRKKTLKKETAQKS